MWRYALVQRLPQEAYQIEQYLFLPSDIVSQQDSHNAFEMAQQRREEDWKTHSSGTTIQLRGSKYHAYG